MTEETQMPVFFTKETQEILDIYADVRSSVNNDQAGSAAEGNVLETRVKINLLRVYKIIAIWLNNC